MTFIPPPGVIKKLAKLKDVNITDLSDDDVLRYDSSSEKFVNVNIPNPLIFKGSISINSDFPTLASVLTGWMYKVTANVTDNDATKTNTGDSFLAGDEIAWNGTDWSVLGSTALWSKTSGVISLVTGTDTLKLDYMNSAGVVFNDASGNLTGGNIIDISTNTNLAVTTPIVLTDDTLSIPVATSSANGYLSSADWDTFNNKVTESTTVSDTNSINLTLTGYDISADILSQNSTTIDLSIDGGGLKADLDSTLKSNYDDAYSKRVDTWGDGLQYSSQTASVDYNATNLKITSTELDTIQGISTTASPEFAGLTLTTFSGIVQASTGVLSASTALADGTTGTTQTASDNSTKIATTAYVDAAVLVEDLWDRAGTVLSPKTAGDDITTTGTMTATTFTDGTASLSAGSLTNVKLGTLTDNGFVKTSGADGTLSVDTNTYLTSVAHTDLTDMPSAINTDHDGRYYTETEIGATASPSGASLVGIEDSGTYFTGTEVETALQEVGDKFDAMNEPTGFPNRTDSVITWSDSGPDYTLSIAPTNGSFSFYQDGLKYTKSGTETHQISGAEGLHYIYYDSGSLASTANPTFGQEFVIITTKVLVAIVYWDATNSEGIYIGEERHGITMDGDTHATLHFSVGLRWYTGIALNTIDADQSGADNAHAQFGVDTGNVGDEDIGLTTDAVISTTGLPVYWRSGGDGDWRKDTNNGYSFLISGTRPNWNEFTGDAWQQTEVGDKDFMLVHVFATTEKDNPIIAIMGQAVYEKKKQAREGATTEVGNLLLGNLPGPEITPIASVIFECKNAYTNDVNARIVTTDEGDEYVDWRTSDITRTAAGGDHGSLGGLADDDHSQYWVDTTIDTRTTNYTTTGTVTVGTLTDGIASLTNGKCSAKGYSANVVTKTGIYTATVTDDVILGNGTFTITLPAAAGVTGKIFNIKNIGTGTITVDGDGGETIDGDATVDLIQDEVITIICNGSNWWII